MISVHGAVFIVNTADCSLIGETVRTCVLIRLITLPIQLSIDGGHQKTEVLDLTGSLKVIESVCGWYGGELPPPQQHCVCVHDVPPLRKRRRRLLRSETRLYPGYFETSVVLSRGGCVSIQYVIICHRLSRFIPHLMGVWPVLCLLRILSSSGTVNLFPPDMECEDADYRGIPTASVTALIPSRSSVLRRLLEWGDCKEWVHVFCLGENIGNFWRTIGLPLGNAKKPSC